MKINKVQIHQEKVFVILSQEIIEELIINYIAEKSGMKIDKSTSKNIVFSNSDCGTEGFKTRVRVELINEILPTLNSTNNPLPIEY